MIPQLTGFYLIVALSLVLGLLSVGKAFGSNKGIHYLDQGFDEETRQTFYHAQQGTRLLPYSWFLVLEQATNSDRFLAEENLRRFGIFPDHNTLKNPAQLPVGLVKTNDSIEKDSYVGLTSAACHTTEITYNLNLTK